MSPIVKNTLLGGCAIFTIAMGVWTLMGFIFAGPEYGLVITITLLIGCLALAGLQTLWFTNTVVKQLAYPARVLCFGLCAFAVLAACAYFGQWFPTDDLGAWASFAVIYLVILGVMTAVFAVRYRRTARDLDDALARYRSGRPGEGGEKTR